MPDDPPKTLSFVDRTIGVAKMIGPLLLSQWTSGSEKYALHEGRLASVEAARELVVHGVQLWSEQLAKMNERLIDAPFEQQPLIYQAMEFAQANVRELRVRQTALSLPPLPSNVHEQTALSDQLEASEHWMDRFRTLARGQNEPWRSTLLARALQRESAQPGSLTPRLLWLIGTLEQAGFRTFMDVLDLCSWIGHHQLIPQAGESIYMRPVPLEISHTLSDVGSLVSDIEELGLLGSISTFEKFPPDLTFHAAYGERRLKLLSGKDGFVVTGVILTRLGRELASLYDPIPNQLGKAIFDDWVAEFQRTGESQGHWG